METYIVYVKTNASSYITGVNSSDFLEDTAGWLKIDSGYGDKYHHAQHNYFPQPIYTESGVYRYKLVDGKPIECTAEEIAAQVTQRLDILSKGGGYVFNTIHNVVGDTPAENVWATFKAVHDYNAKHFG